MGRQQRRPTLRKRYLTIGADTRFSPGRLIAVLNDVRNGVCNNCLIFNRFFAAVVALGLPARGRSVPLPVSLNLFQSLAMVVLCSPNVIETC